MHYYHYHEIGKKGALLMMMGFMQLSYAVDPSLLEALNQSQEAYNNLTITGNLLNKKYEDTAHSILFYNKALDENRKEMIELDKKRSFLRNLFDNPDIGFPSDSTMEHYELIDARENEYKQLNKLARDINLNKRMQAAAQQEIVNINDTLIASDQMPRVPSTRYYWNKKIEKPTLRPLHRQFKYAKRPTEEQIAAYEMFKPSRVLKVEPKASWWKWW